MILGKPDTLKGVERKRDNCPGIAPVDCNNGFCCPRRTNCKVQAEDGETDCETDFGLFSGFALPAIRGDGTTTSTTSPTSTSASSTSTTAAEPTPTTTTSTATETDVIKSTVTVTPTPASTPSSSSISMSTSIVEPPPLLSSDPAPNANTNTRAFITLLPTSPLRIPPSSSSKQRNVHTDFGPWT